MRHARRRVIKIENGAFYISEMATAYSDFIFGSVKAVDLLRAMNDEQFCEEHFSEYDLEPEENELIRAIFEIGAPNKHGVMVDDTTTVKDVIDQYPREKIVAGDWTLETIFLLLMLDSLQHIAEMESSP